MTTPTPHPESKTGYVSRMATRHARLMQDVLDTGVLADWRLEYALDGMLSLKRRPGTRDASKDRTQDNVKVAENAFRIFMEYAEAIEDDAKQYNLYRWAQGIVVRRALEKTPERPS